MITCFPYQRPEWASLEAIKEVNVEATFPEVVCKCACCHYRPPSRIPIHFQTVSCPFLSFFSRFPYGTFFFFFTWTHFLECWTDLLTEYHRSQSPLTHPPIQFTILQSTPCLYHLQKISTFAYNCRANATLCCGLFWTRTITIEGCTMLSCASDDPCELTLTVHVNRPLMMEVTWHRLSAKPRDGISPRPFFTHPACAMYQNLFSFWCKPSKGCCLRA